MEFSDERILDILNDLVKGQATTTQAIVDLKSTMEKGLSFVQKEHSDLEERVRGCEKKVWYVSGAGAAVGFLAGVLGKHFGIR